jgi:glutathione S-transferase
MKLYEFTGAPNPRRARIFIAEKALSIETKQVDLRSGAQFYAAYRAINPRCVVPTLVLDDGTAIGEVAAIWRYLEETTPEPSLFGKTAKDRALVTMWAHRWEIDGLLAVAEAVRNILPGLKSRALVGPHDYEQIPALADRGLARTHDFFADLEETLKQQFFAGGDTYSAADITALVAVDFAVERLKLEIPGEYQALRDWRARVASRPSASA